MGNYRFKFSDMLPNAWFYKLRDMGKNTTTTTATRNNNNRKKTATKKLSTPPPLPNNNNQPSEMTKVPLSSSSDQRKSYYFTRDNITLHHHNSPIKTEPPRKSSRIRSRRLVRQNLLQPPRLVSSKVSAGCSCRATLDSVFDSPNDLLLVPVNSSDENGSDHGLTTEEADIEFNLRPDLPPIITKKDNLQPSVKRGLTANSSSTSSPGVKLRTKIASRRIVQGRKSTRRTESFAVVKTSKDPGRDFRESMAEMIAENDIRAAKDLEELLACYLSLNSDEYHQLIIDVFKQIWFDIAGKH